MKKLLLFSLVFCLVFCLVLPSLAAPGKVTNVKAPKKYLKSNQAKITWNSQSNIDKYILKLRNKKGKLLRTKRASNAYFTFKKLKKNKVYKLKVRAKDIYSSLGPWSDKKRIKTKSWKFYHNAKYGFNLKFPKSWKGFDVEKVVISESEVNAIYLYFKMPTTDPAYQDSPSNGYASLFCIALYTPAQWDILENSDYAEMLGEKLAETSDYVYVYSHAQAAPTDLYTQVNKLTKIKNSFKLD